MNLSEQANIGIEHENMGKNVSNMMEVYGDTETKFHNLVNAYYTLEDTFNGSDIDFLKTYLKESIDNIMQINENESNKIYVIKDVLNAYEGEAAIMNEGITKTTTGLEDNLLEKGMGKL